MYFITICPDELYFHWQLQVQHYNFIVKHKIAPENIICLLGSKGEINLEFAQYCKKIGVKLINYDISNLDMSYKPIIRPNLLKRFYKDYPEFKEKYVFIHDSDIIFTKLPYFKGITNDNWYLSDCNNYLGYEYLKRFGNTLLTEMCNIVGIKQQLLLEKDNNCGGAQYYGNDLDWRFWEKVENDTIKLFNVLKIQSEINKKEFFDIHNVELGKNNAIQAWTAGMWADLWNLHLRKNVITHKELDFS